MSGPDTGATPQIDPNLLDGGYSLEASLTALDYAGHLDTPGDLDDGDYGGGGGGGGGGSGVKRKNGPGAKDAESPAPKRTRQSQSCDACRARKVKCDRPPPGSAAALASPKDICSHCEQLNLPCTFDYKPKKRGPPNLYLRKMRSGDLDDSSIDGSPRVMGSARDSKPYGYDMGGTPSFDRRTSGMSVGGTLASLNSMQASALSHQGESIAPSMGRHVDEAWDEALAKSVAAHAHAASLDPTSAYPQSTAHLPPPPRTEAPRGSPLAHLSSPSTSFASPPYAGIPHNPNNPLEMVIPRGLLYHIVDLFFDYVYPLTPCLHKPTFMRDLHAKREERPGQEEFTHMVYSLVSSTLSQLPRSFVAMPRREVQGLIQRCYGLCRSFMYTDCAVLTVDRMVMMYFSTLTASLMNGTLRGFSPSMIFGAHCSAITTLGLCDERTYQTMDPISRELHRRIFWLAYGADRSSSAVEGNPLLFNEVDCGDVAFPSETDDEYISEEGYLPQPEDKTSILSGFYYISRLFRLTAQLMEKRRQDRRNPPHGVVLQIRLNEVDELHERVMGLMDDCPEVLKLDFDTNASMRMGAQHQVTPQWPFPHALSQLRVGHACLPSTRSAKSRMAVPPPEMKVKEEPRSPNDGETEEKTKCQQNRSMSPDWDAQVSADVRQLFLDPKSSKAVAKDAYLVQQANIYVSQQMTRLMLIQYREELHGLQQEEMAKATSPVRDPRDRRYSNTRKLGKEAFSEEEKEQVMIDLLIILQKIPIQVIAVNSLPLVSKVRMIASTLLDSIGENGVPIQPDMRGSTERKQRAQAYLWDFLKILSEIEALYSMNEDAPKNGGASA